MRGPAVERVEQLKKLRLMEALRLDEETSIRFFARYNEHQEELRKIGLKRSGLIDQLQLAIKGSAADADVDKLLKDILAVETLVIDARSKFLDTLRPVLTVKQIGQYVVFERNFNQDLRELMREMAQDRMQRGRN
ncbi:MAG: hypothetical protein A3H45_10975 [Ignavibacteria bacterium RIFCSPLOWO2_02_FULL_55_14]|nr:MAG: hypothetical protein A3H45_10975 [Ignavibacteria bacterium RIFCSPLOWO2_02_FULL_55_14]